jgi:repressor LexA
MEELLSARQLKMLDYIRLYVTRNGYPPSTREIGKAVGISSTSVVDYNLKRLAKKGLITRDPLVSRGLRFAKETAMSFAPASLALPIVGRIAAGQPIEALQDVSEYVQLTPEFAREGCFILQVKGRSMIDDLIDDGDLVVVEPQSAANNGDIVVALLENGEATLKRFYWEKDQIRLQPANSDMNPIYVRPDQLRIQGKVVTVIRRIR